MSSGVYSGTLRAKMPETSNPAAAGPPALLSDQDLYLFNEGSNYRLHEKMGAECAPDFGDRQL
jgi:hypothetical protein